jgi:hypothetical protein
LRLSATIPFLRPHSFLDENELYELGDLTPGSNKIFRGRSSILITAVFLG